MLRDTYIAMQYLCFIKPGAHWPEAGAHLVS